jgi:hypothetical protein
LSKDDREKLERKFVHQNISLHKNFSDERPDQKNSLKNSPNKNLI